MNAFVWAYRAFVRHPYSMFESLYVYAFVEDMVLCAY